MKKSLIIALIFLLVFGLAASTHSVWNPENSVTKDYENENWEIIVKDLKPASGMLEAKSNQQGKRTMYLEPQSLPEMRETCKVLYDNSITENPSPCQKFY